MIDSKEKVSGVPNGRNTKRNARKPPYATESKKTSKKQPSVPRSEKVLKGENKKLPLRQEPTTVIEMIKNLSNVLKQQTINPFYKIDLSSYALEYRLYFRVITHFFTLLYRNHRVMEEKAYRTTREDIIAALQLLESLGLKQERKQTREAEEIYQIAKRRFSEQHFKARELQNELGMAKTTTHRFLILLLERKWVSRTGYNNRGYYYQLVEQTEFID